MIRKAILLLLTMAAAGAAAAWGLSYYRVCLERNVYDIPPGPHVPAFSARQHRVSLMNGYLYVHYSKFPTRNLGRPAERHLKIQDPPGMHWETAGELDGWAFTVARAAHGWGLDISGNSNPPAVVVSTPLWLPTLLFAIYPAIAVLCRRIRGRLSSDPSLCSQCGYNLTGNQSGTCPECGTTIAS